MDVPQSDRSKGYQAMPKAMKSHVVTSAAEARPGGEDYMTRKKRWQNGYKVPAILNGWRKRVPFIFWASTALIVAMLLAAIITGAIFGSLAHKAQAVDVATVNLGYAQYESVLVSNGVRKWLGIRYAAAPLGDLRFRAPRDPSNIIGLQTADQHGPVCIGQNSGTSEDCLFLDVYTPANAFTNSTLPVYVFLQGGGFNSNGNANYDGTGLIKASNDSIVIVTLGYRVSLYGFLASEEIAGNGDTNNGLKDQRKALEWVQKHISQFGGDPKHVTIGGGSAGAASVALQLAAYGGRDDGLFQATAAESSSFGPQLTITQSQYQYDALVVSTNCNATEDTLACLRNKTTEQLDAVNSGNINYPFGNTTGPPLFMYTNVIDGNFTADYTYNMFAQGKYVKVPAIWGADTNDGTVFTPGATASIKHMNDFLNNNFPLLTESQLAQIDAYYPKQAQFPSKGSYFTATAQAYGDMRYKCPSLALSTNYSNAKIPVWTYRYNVVDNPNNGIGTGHTQDVTAVWGPSCISGSPPKSYLPGASNANIVPIMMGYWTSFIRSKDPSLHRYAGSPTWDQWVSGSWNRILLEANTTRMETVSTDEQTHCNYFTSIGVSIQQ